MSEHAPRSEVDARADFHSHFGYSDTDVSEYGKYSDDAEELSIGSDDVVMWIPDDMTLPLGIPVAEFEETVDVQPAVGDCADDENVRGDETDVLVFDNGLATEHVIRETYVEKLASMADTSVAEMCQRARLHADFAHYPVLFPLETGRILVAPFVGDYTITDE